MQRSFLRAIASFVALFVVSATVSAQASLNDVLTPFLAKYELPAVAAAVVKDGTIAAAGAVGTRRAGQDIPVTLEDRFHIGSDTKAMTALLAGMAVDEGLLRWTTTVGEAFPELASTMNPKLAGVTLRQLLSHTSGIAGDNAELVELYEKSASQDGNLDDLRLWVIKQWSSKPMASEPGSTFAYSNLNFIIAGSMIERAYRTTWEELVTERVFVPLGLTTAGLQSQSSYGKVDAPLGHITIDGKQKAILAGPMCDEMAVVGPAGMAHMSVLDFARWAGWNAAEGKRGPALVRAETLKLLHTPVVSPPPRPDAAPGTPARGDYCLGWGKVSVDWAPSPLVHHAGSNSMNLAHIWVDPEHDFAMVVVTNISNRKADEALFAIAPKLYEQFSGAKR
ncbi:MAG: serine hydrolase domain-containing protein [Phycisphaerales bacterium]